MNIVTEAELREQFGTNFSARRKPIPALLWMLSDLPHSIAKWKAKGNADQAARATQMLDAAAAELLRRGYTPKSSQPRCTTQE